MIKKLPSITSLQWEPKVVRIFDVFKSLKVWQENLLFAVNVKEAANIESSPNLNHKRRRQLMIFLDEKNNDPLKRRKAAEGSPR